MGLRAATCYCGRFDSPCHGVYSYRNDAETRQGGGRSSVNDLGNRLREARESRGLSFADVEATTHIRRYFLAALEEERFSDLPASIYTRGFIRTYSAFLGLDPAPLLARYSAAVGIQDLGSPPMLDEPLTRHIGPGPGVTLFLAVMVIIVLGAVGWYSYSRFYLGVDPLAALMQTQAAIMRDTPASADNATLEVVTAAPEVSAAAAATRPSGATLPAPTLPLTATPTLPPATPTRTATRVPTATPVAGVVVSAEVIAPTYVEVTVDSEEVFVGTLQIGDAPVWQGDERVNVRVGNAGGLSLTVNGVSVGTLGTPGEVLTVEYTLDNLPQP